MLLLVLCLGACGASGVAKRSVAARSSVLRAARRTGSPVRRAERSTRSPVLQAERTHEYPSPRPPQSGVGGMSSAAAAVLAFVTAYINWRAGTVSRDMRTLAAHSIGQARAAMQLAAAQTASDYELRRGGIGNSGSVEAVAPVRDAQNRYIVVTRELTIATATATYQGLEPAWHVVVVTVSQERPGQWVVSGWQPES